MLTGILIGTLTMEMGGKVTINCPKTGYKCEIEFKLKVSGLKIDDMTIIIRIDPIIKKILSFVIQFSMESLWKMKNHIFFLIFPDSNNTNY